MRALLGLRMQREHQEQTEEPDLLKVTSASWPNQSLRYKYMYKSSYHVDLRCRPCIVINQHSPKTSICKAPPRSSQDSRQTQKHCPRHLQSPFPTKQTLSKSFTNRTHLPSTSLVHTSAAHKLRHNVNAHPTIIVPAHPQSPISRNSVPCIHAILCGTRYPTACMIGPCTKYSAKDILPRYCGIGLVSTLRHFEVLGSERARSKRRIAVPILG